MASPRPRHVEQSHAVNARAKPQGIAWPHSPIIAESEEALAAKCWPALASALYPARAGVPTNQGGVAGSFALASPGTRASPAREAPRSRGVVFLCVGVRVYCWLRRCGWVHIRRDRDAGWVVGVIWGILFPCVGVLQYAGKKLDTGPLEPAPQPLLPTPSLFWSSHLDYMWCLSRSNRRSSPFMTAHEHRQPP